MQCRLLKGILRTHEWESERKVRGCSWVEVVFFWILYASLRYARAIVFAIIMCYDGYG